MMPHFKATATWSPLASESQRFSILRILDDLERSFRPDQRETNPCLSGGTAGTALFLGYLSKLPGRKGLEKRAMDLLGQAVERVEYVPGAQFYSGYSGIAWTVEHLQHQVFPAGAGAGDEDANAGVDEVLLDLLALNPWRDSYDLISGLVGYGVYALERLSRPSAQQILTRIIEHLAALATPQSTGHSWPTAPELLPPWQREQAPRGYLNLGLAHGVPAILLLLAAIEKAGGQFPGLNSSRAGSLLEGGMSWFFSQFQDPRSGSYLAAWCPVEQESEESGGGRVAWCYGDLGVSLTILNTARLAKRSDWEAKALDMARLAAKRPLEMSGVQDVSLCHGSAGNVLIFQRLYQLTREECFWQAAQMYLKHLIHTRNPGNPYAGYTAYRPETDAGGKEKVNPYRSEPGLLEGAAGAGLALLAALGVEPKWDRFMMLSLPDGL